MQINPNYIMLRIDKKQFINELRAMNDNFVELWIDTTNKKSIQIKDRFKIITTSTRN